MEKNKSFNEKIEWLRDHYKATSWQNFVSENLKELLDNYDNAKNKDEKKKAKEKLILYHDTQIDAMIAVGMMQKEGASNLNELGDILKKKSVKINEKNYEKQRQQYLKDNPQNSTKLLISVLFGFIVVMLIYALIKQFYL